MDFNQAIAAHSAWKKKLKAYLARPDGSLVPTQVASDRDCTLGQWIHADAPEYSAIPEFTVLQNSHARFHKIAAQLVTRANSGEPVTAEMAVGARSDFTAASSAVVLALIAMKKRMAK